MKKAILTLVIFMAFTSLVSAQKKQSKGDGSSSPMFLSAEVNLSFARNPININYLKARLFLNKTMAIRLGLGLNSLSNTSKVTAAGLPDEETKNKYFIFGLYPGFELHLGHNDRLSPYVGAELGFSVKTSGTTVTNVGNVLNNKTECKSIWGDGTNPAYLRIGFNLVTGADFYVVKGLFVGVEVGFGFAYTNNNDSDVSNTVGTTTTTVTTPGSKISNIGVNFNPCIRLGWTF